jgi:D-lactate dehydrogenase
MDKKCNIAFFDTKPYDKEFFEAENKKHGFEIRFLETHLNLETAMLAQGSQAVCVFVNDRLSQSVIGALCELNVKLIALRCAGYNNVDLKAAKGKIKVVRVPKYSPYAVAEHTVGLMLSLNRKLHRAYSRTRDNNFNIAGLMGFDMHGKTAGVIGSGYIGKEVVRILKGFGMNVLVYDIDRSQIKDGTYADLETIYKKSDVITLHCPLTAENKHMIGKTAIEKMKDGVILINTGRGGLIDTYALVESLKSKKIGAAGLDVYEEESEFFYEDFSYSFITDDILARLLTFPNVLITSHQAFFTKEAMHNIAATTLDNIAAFSEGKNLINEISLP